MDRLVPPNGRPNVPLPGAPSERFLSWCLPLLSNANSNGEAAEVALLSLHEFLTACEPASIERYITSILRSCQALLEDEATPLNILRPLLGILTVLANRFNPIFEPHFADLVDLLLGWALMPDLSESDRNFITESFLHFQKLWAGNLPFSSNLLCKFLGDMEVLAQDAIPGSLNQPRRLWALASCFVAVLRATSSGILEFGFKEESLDSFRTLLPRLMVCLGMVGQKFRSFKWLREAFTCLSLFANLFREKFSNFSCLATEFLLKSLKFDTSARVSHEEDDVSLLCACFPSLTSAQVQEILKINLELISLQGPVLPSEAVSKLLQEGSSFTRLRLHPSRAVTGLVSETYLLLLRYDSHQVIQVATDCVIHELITLKRCLGNLCDGRTDWQSITTTMGKEETLETWVTNVSELECRELIKYNLLLLTCSVHLMHDQLGYKSEKTFLRSKEIQKFLISSMCPFQSPLQSYADVQLAVVQSLHRLCWLKCINISNGNNTTSFKKGVKMGCHMCKIAISDCLAGCDKVLAEALNPSASFSVKVEVLDWIGNICNEVLAADSFVSCSIHKEFFQKNIVNEETFALNLWLSKDVILALLIAASDREQKVRGKVATILNLLLHSRLIKPLYLKDVAEVALEHLGDTGPGIQNAFRELLAAIAPVSLWATGLTANVYCCGSSLLGTTHGQWKKYFALRRFSRHLRPQQVVFILNYIAQQWQVLPSSWLQRLVQNLPKDMAGDFGKDAESLLFKQGSGSVKLNQEDLASPPLDINTELLERMCTNNNLVSAWWAIQEAAWHCVTVRLRTHLGGPTQTFGVLERMLLDVVQSLQADNSQREGATAVVKQHSQLLPMRLLLEFVDSLRKNIYNATEGSVVLSTPSPASTHFFRANRKVCEEWFSRICEALMNASLALQCYAATYHHTTLRLHDLRSAAVTAMREMQWPQTTDNNPSNLKLKVRQDVLKTLRLATLALCRAHEPSTIRGLQIWANSTFGAVISDDALLLQTVSGMYGSLGWMNGAMLQSQGHYERAATYFSKLLQSEDSLTALGADGVQFVIARTIESYVALADWEALEIWLQELQTLRAQHAGKSYAGALTTAGHDMNSIHAFACFDAGDVPGAWAHLDLTPQSSGDLTPDPHLALQRSEQMLLQALLHLQGDATENCVKEMEKAKSILEESLVVSGFDGLTHAAPLLMHLHCIKAFEVNCSTADIRERDSSSHLTMFKSLEQLDCLPLDASHQDCGMWLKLMRIYKAIMPHFKVSTQVQWHMIRLARKQQNFRLCHRLLNRLCNAINLDNNSGTGYNVSGEEFSPFQYEFMLLQYAEGNSQEALIGLWNLVQGFITSSKRPDDFKKEIVAKASLKLASWIKKNPILPAGFFLQKGHDMIDDAALGKHLMLEDINLRRGDNSRFPAHSQQEVIGAAVKSAALMFPTMGKAWFAYGSWCFNLAKASFSGPNGLKYPSLFPQILNSEIAPNSSWFSDEEVNRIRAVVLDAIVNSADATQLHLQVNLRKVSGLQVKGEFNETFMQHIVHLMQMAAGAVESDGESPSRMLSMQLKLEISGQCPGMSSLQTVAYVNNLIEIWWGLRKRRVCLYEHALEGFLKYINLSNWKDHRGGNTLAQMKHKRDQTLGSSLYVLHILFNHGIELNDTLRKGISSISPRSWQEVTPQLFARLTNHPEPLVRKLLEDILSMLAQLSPWAIVYPVLVSINTSDGEPPPEIQQLLGCLLKMHPKLVKDVQLLIAELGGITVLWEERWMSTLQDLRPDVIRRITLLKEEALRLTEDNAHISMEKPNINGSKYSATMLPVISTLERLISITTRPPKTAHESWFQQHYIPQIKDAISGFKLPTLNVSSLNDVWRPFDAIVASLASHVKRSVVPLDDIAPRLVFLGSSDVPIPGLEKPVGLAHGESPLGGIPEMVTLTAFHKEVQLLATKTKPKKLAMIGSDGQTYTYLLKGHEDLRLDARIMQLLRAVNKMLSSYSSSRGGHLVARHYSVTPISGQAGLIQWVDNLVSMYAVFKAWQQRNHSAQYANPGHANMPVPPAIPRPSDMFYGKMIPALKERGLRKVMSRKDWPHDVKRKVLLELMKETPRQLLYKELWCASDGFTAFNAKLQRFCGTVAVMSIVGYILGLGDRHLDNILMDFNMGDIVHIDYNVCFEKGLRLKIPEIVPFRLTQSMQGALGLTGVEGAFRQSCEDVLQTLRTNKDTILMLLDVFAWDPLMEWTKSDGVNEGHLFGEEDKNGIEAVAVGPDVQEHRTELQVSEAEAVLGSQEVRSQEVMMASEVAESSIAREHIGHLRDISENLDKSLDEHVLSQAEDDCWISPPNTGLDDESSSEKENANHLESFWLQSTDSLSGSRIWQSTLMSEYPEQKNSSMVVPDISTLAIEEQNDNNTSLQKLHSQGRANSDIESSQVSKKMNQIDDDVFQPSMSPNGLPSQNSNGLIMGALLDLIDEPNNDKKSSQTRKTLHEIENDYHANASPLYSMTHRSRSKKNAYAVSVLERVEWKLDGLDNDGRRHFTVSEQVDYLLRQAMSIDNLCNMYEGWTPWI